MSIAETITNLQHKTAGIESEHLENFFRVAMLIAKGATMSPNKVAAALSESGKSYGDLEAVATVYQRRLTLAEQLVDKQDIKAQTEKIEKEIVAERWRYNELARDYNRSRVAKEFERDALHQKIIMDRAAQRQLILTCQDPVLLRKEKVIADERRRLGDQLAQLQHSRLSAEEVLRERELDLRQMATTNPNLKRLKAQIGNLELRIKDFQKRRSQLTTDVKNLDDQIEAIREQKLKP